MPHQIPLAVGAEVAAQQEQMQSQMAPVQMAVMAALVRPQAFPEAALLMLAAVVVGGGAHLTSMEQVALAAVEMA
jgi:hypothetical protein